MEKHNKINSLYETANTNEEVNNDGIPDYLLEDPLDEADSVEPLYLSPIPEWAL